MNATGWKLVITITLRRHECGMINVFVLLVSVIQYQKVSMNGLHITAVTLLNSTTSGRNLQRIPSIMYF